MNCRRVRQLSDIKFIILLTHGSEMNCKLQLQCNACVTFYSIKYILFYSIIWFVIHTEQFSSYHWLILFIWAILLYVSSFIQLGGRKHLLRSALPLNFKHNKNLILRMFLGVSACYCWLNSWKTVPHVLKVCLLSIQMKRHVFRSMSVTHSVSAFCLHEWLMFKK